MVEGLPLPDERSDVLIDGGHFFFRQGDAASGFLEDELVLFLGFSGGILLFLQGAEVLLSASIANIGRVGESGAGLLLVPWAVLVTAGALAARNRVGAFLTGGASLAVGPVQAVVKGAAIAAGATEADASPDLLGDRSAVLADRSADGFERGPILEQLLDGQTVIIGEMSVLIHNMPPVNDNCR